MRASGVQVTTVMATICIGPSSGRAGRPGSACRPHAGPSISESHAEHQILAFLLALIRFLSSRTNSNSRLQLDHDKVATRSRSRRACLGFLPRLHLVRRAQRPSAAPSPSRSKLKSASALSYFFLLSNADFLDRLPTPFPRQSHDARHFERPAHHRVSSGRGRGAEGEADDLWRRGPHRCGCRACSRGLDR